MKTTKQFIVLAISLILISVLGIQCEEDSTVEVSSVLINKSELSLNTGESFTFTTLILPGNADNKEVIWESSDENIATAEKGVVSAIAEGNANITVTTNDGAKSAVCILTVSDPIVAVTGISLSETSMSVVMGSTVTLTATVAPEDATDKTLSWTSSDEAIATVANGVVTPVAIGTATISVKTEDGDFTQSCELTVSANIISVTGVSLSENIASVIMGGSLTLTASVAPANASDKTVVWTSSDESIATVANGVVTPVAVGTATISVKTVDGDFTQNCELTVSADIISVTGVSLSENTASVIMGGSLTLTATVAPADASDKTVIWTSSDEAIATVVNGVVTPVALGTATITVKTVDGDFTQNCELTVSSDIISVTGVSLSENTASLTIGESLTLTATVAPANASDKTVVWTSSDESIATVANGVVTPVAVGAATITVKTVDGDYTQNCELTIADAAVATTMTDSRDNKEYKITTIGNQVWMAENLAYLPAVSSAAEFAADASHYGVYGYEGNDVDAAKAEDNYATHGVIYNGYVVVNEDVCPSGWHVPTDDEWKELEMAVGISADDIGDLGVNYGAESIAKLLSTSWGGGTDDFGFNVLQSGRLYNNTFSALDVKAFLWSKTLEDETNLIYRIMTSNGIKRNKKTFSNGYSIRCVKD